jgi:hypothetical protein
MKKRYRYLIYCFSDKEKLSGIVPVTSSIPLSQDNTNQMNWVKKECERYIKFNIEYFIIKDMQKAREEEIEKRKNVEEI